MPDVIESTSAKELRDGLRLVCASLPEAQASQERLYVIQAAQDLSANCPTQLPKHPVLDAADTSPLLREHADNPPLSHGEQAEESDSLKNSASLEQNTAPEQATTLRQEICQEVVRLLERAESLKAANQVHERRAASVSNCLLTTPDSSVHFLQLRTNLDRSRVGQSNISTTLDKASDLLH